MRFEVLDDREFSFQPGNFVGIEAHVEGSGYRRSPYCIASVPTGRRRFEIVVRVVPDGPVARYLAGVCPGDEVAFRGPKGRSMIPRDRTRDVVLVATGVALGPCLSQATQLLGEGFDRRIDLLWDLRSTADLWAVDDLERLAAAHPNFGYRISLSQPPEDWAGLRGRVTETVPGQLPLVGSRQYYLLGNGRIVAELAAALSDVGVPQQAIYEEAYFDAHHVPDPAVVSAIRTRFTAADAKAFHRLVR